MMTTTNKLIILFLTLITLSIFVTNLKRKQTRQLPVCLHSHTSASDTKQIKFRPELVDQGAPNFLRSLLQNKTGFEIGGPSSHTWSPLGVYDMVKKLDVTNFASDTLWEKGLIDGSDFIWEKKVLGKHYIRDAVDLRGIPDESYDFVLASHVLEHIANPFKALLEWRRILQLHGLLLLILPQKETTFDHNRPIDSFGHLTNDFKNRTSEGDLSHLNEILRLHDLSMDGPAGNIEAFKTRSDNNLKNRGLHQHVYDQQLLHSIFVCLQMKIINQTNWSSNQLIIGEKLNLKFS